MTVLSTVTIGSALWLLLALATALTGNGAGGFRAALAVLCTAVVVGGVLKPGIGRERPSLALEGVVVYTSDRPDSRSFPSGHAAGAAAGAYSLSRTWISAYQLVVPTEVTASASDQAVCRRCSTATWRRRIGRQTVLADAGYATRHCPLGQPRNDRRDFSPLPRRPLPS